ncbi:cyclic peptide export ABC transporter [Thalassospira sp. CH_XMU1448-2]|uniref:cyclic peptide export ABC transporter n=1 Tax=Thalassospira sp. CH_XMU1448-2 TaxID=3107773 RepID=UPI003008D036
MLMFRLLKSRVGLNLRTVFALSSMSAIATTLVLVVVNLASDQAQEHKVNLQLLLMMVVSLGGYMWAQHKSDVMVSDEVEAMLHEYRVRLFDQVRKAGPDVLAKVGQGSVHAAITSEMQTISNSLPIMLNGAQQIVLVVCVGLYLAWLSIFAFVMLAVLVVLAGFIHVHRINRVNAATRASEDDEAKLFDGLNDLLAGFKEVKMNTRRRNALVEQLGERSKRACSAKALSKAQWSRESASIQLAFYAMMAAMVFIVPIFTSDYHDVAVQVTTATMFLIGPIGTVIMTFPSFNNAETSLGRIVELENNLSGVIDAQEAEMRDKSGSMPQESSPSASSDWHEKIDEIALEDVRFAYRSSTNGFAVGPLDAVFRRGEITFISGGNGAGKSTIISLLTGLRDVDSGSIRINGHALRPDDMQAYRDSFATVLSDYHLFSELYGIEKVDEEKVNALLREMEVDHKVTLDGLSFSTTALSQGQRKRLALIAARLEGKPVLVLDEWAADQDPHFRKVFYEEILPAMRKLGKVIICVTHDDRWFHIADQVCHVRDGIIDAVRSQ